MTENSTPENRATLTSHCFHWTERGEECCDCGMLDPDGSLWYVRDCPGLTDRYPSVSTDD